MCTNTTDLVLSSQYLRSKLIRLYPLLALFLGPQLSGEPLVQIEVFRQQTFLKRKAEEVVGLLCSVQQIAEWCMKCIDYSVQSTLFNVQG